MSDYQKSAGDVGLAADKEIGSLNSRVNTLTEQLSTANDQVLTAEADQAAAEDKVTLTSNQLKLCRARNARLRQQLEALSAPVVKMAVGSATGMHTYDEFTDMAGSPMKARRSYEPSPRDSITHSSMNEDVGRCISVNSVAFNPDQITANEATIEAYLRSVPGDHELFYIQHHEPENPAKKYDPVAFIESQKRTRKIVYDVNTTREVPIKFGGCFMAWSVRTQANRNMRAWMPPVGTWDFLSWDGYSGSADQYYSVVSIFADSLAFTREYGLQYAIAECGIHVQMPVADRVRWIDECQQYAADAGSAFWTYWDGSFSTFWLNTPEEFRAVVEGP